MTPVPTPPADWTAALEQAFGVLLKTPLSEFGTEGEYGAFYGGNWLTESGFDRNKAWLRPAALAGTVTVTSEDLLLLDEEGYPELRFDARGSLFEINARAALPTGFRDDVVAARTTGSARWPQIRGSVLAELAARHGLDLPAGLPKKSWSVAQARIASDGTLVDALRVATGMGDGFDGLVPSTESPEVAEVAHAGIRSHLGAFCDPRSDDLALSGPGADDDESVLIRWDGAVDQFEITVERIA